MSHRARDRLGAGPEGTLVVLGGYGAVGRHVADALATWYPGRVVVAGRDPQRAVALAREVPGVVAGRGVDVRRPDEVRALLEGAHAVVMCVEVANREVAELCLEAGVHYVDVSASAEVLAAIEALDGVARASGGSAVLSVGLAPGVTNLLARQVAERLPSATAVDIAIVLGLGGDHGPDSLRWTVERLVRRRPSGAPRAAPATVDVPGFGRRRLHPFDFSDQHTLSRTLGIPVRSRVGFDSSALTAAVFALRTAGVLAPFRGERGRAALRAVFSRARAGAPRFVVQAEASDARGRRAWAATSGEQEARATGVVAAHVMRSVLEGALPGGVLHVHELPGWRDLLARLAREMELLEGGSGDAT